MITIANSRAEKAARKLARQLGTTITEAVAVACERLLHEQDAAALGKRRGEAIDRMWADLERRGMLEGTPEERARRADHRDLYGPDGLPR
ncbi:MAG: type II toxin-antitoxin system VapB family antitoxin [Pseudomonadota bacterium]